MKLRILDGLRKSETTLSRYLNGMQGLMDSGVFNFVRLLGVVEIHPKMTVDEAALAGARSKGFNECLDILFNFKELFLDVPEETGTPEPTFGSLERALELGDITQEEYDAIKSGSTGELFNKLTNNAGNAGNPDKSN